MKKISVIVFPGSPSVAVQTLLTYSESTFWFFILWEKTKIGKYKINVRREFEKQGATILENVMCMIYDEMEARKKNKK